MGVSYGRRDRSAFSHFSVICGIPNKKGGATMAGFFASGWRRFKPYRFGMASSALWGGLQLMGITSAHWGEALLVVSALLWLSPLIESIRLMQIRFDPSPKTPIKQKKIYTLNDPISHALMASAIILAVVVFLTGVHRFISINIIVAQEGAVPSLSKLIEVDNKIFRHEDVVLDGYSYKNCQFDSVRFIYNGGLSALKDCIFTPTSVAIATTNATVGSTIILLTALRLFHPEYRSPIPIEPGTEKTID
jgi:hypothetical protein